MNSSKCKFSDLPLLALKFTKFIMEILEQRVNSSSHFASLYSVMSHNSYEILYLKHYMFGQKEPIKVQFFRFLRALMKVHLILYAVFETARSGFIQI